MIIFITKTDYLSENMHVVQDWMV